jgi:3-hydroxyisobutyrate dehydrogenase-like beta-hydroxyacid dehydrogenase
LNFIVSGDDAIIAKIKPLLNNAGAVNIWEYGNEPGNSNAAKLCTNYMIMAALQAMSESISLARKSGIDEKQFMKMITAALFNCGVYINYGNLVLNETFKPAGFSLVLGLKDATLVKQQAETAGAKMPLGNLIQQEYQQLFDNGYADYDWSALALSIK